MGPMCRQSQVPIPGATSRGPRAMPSRSLQAVEILETAKKPILYSGGGVVNSGPRDQRAAARAGGRDRVPDHLDPDGAGLLSGERRALGRHAGHARHLRGEHGDARLRCHDLHRGALRRPDHRAHGCVQPRLAQGAYRYRPELDQQEHPCRGSDCRRCRLGAGGHAGRLARARVEGERYPPAGARRSPSGRR